ncbi:unnamed protein product [Gongylonema pulchrum]|uniref:Secreted protein n=1 Tax=Gongylonema pulchrum TaxID=637853 RepID=A0A183CUD2_9BILA|nr:unnamed protein product [Gongylonema pulchrum]
MFSVLALVWIIASQCQTKMSMLQLLAGAQLARMRLVFYLLLTVKIS